MIRIEKLYKQFGALEVLKGIDLNIDRPGSITAILGPNSSGKTTLIKCVLGMVLPDRGEISVQGKSIKGEWAYRGGIDYLPQIARFPENLTVRELISCIRDIRGGQPKESELIALFHLEEQLDKKLSTLSGGTRQKVNLTLAFMYDSPVLILDEPTSGLDPVAMVTLRELIAQAREKDKMILITTHIMSFVEELADEIIFLLEGKIYFRGSVTELKARYNESSVERAIAQILRGNTITTGNGSSSLSGVTSAQSKGQ